VIAREYFPMRIMGTVFGAAAVFSSLGMALGPPSAAGSSTPPAATLALYRPRSASASARVAIALAFPPFHHASARVAQPA